MVPEKAFLLNPYVQDSDSVLYNLTDVQRDFHIKSTVSPKDKHVFGIQVMRVETQKISTIGMAY